MAKKPLVICLALCLCLALSGCASLTFQNINDLLRAPALGQGQGEIQKALATKLGEEPQYKFPKEGEQRSPLIIEDLDGDGITEGILLYSMASSTLLGTEKGANVYVAVLEQKEGNWEVTQDIAGPTTEVASMQVADLLADGSRQLIIGYGSASLKTKTLAIYTYHEQTLTLERSMAYSNYELADFTGRGGTDLVVVSPIDQVGELQLQYIPTRDGVFEQPQQAVLLDGNFVSCSGIYPSAAPDNQRVMVVDGMLENGMLASQMVFYSGEHFFKVDDSGKMRGQTARLSPLLKSRDIDGDGVVEIPHRVGNNEISTPAADKKLEYVEWLDYSAVIADPAAEPVAKQFGLLDSDRGVYVHLPDNWRDTIKIVDGATKGEWKVQKSQTFETLLSLTVLEPGDALPVGAVSIPGYSDSCISMTKQMNDIERGIVEIVSLS